MILATQSIILHTWCSFTLSYRVQLKSEDLIIRENSKSLKQHLQAGLSVILTYQPFRGEGGWVLNKFLYGEGPPNNVLYTIFHDFVCLLLTNGTPFTYLA